MALVRMFCEDCGNDGVPPVSDDGMDELMPNKAYGFVFEAPMVALIQMSQGYDSNALVIGNEFHGNALEALIRASKNKEIECMACQSKNIELVCEVDARLERQEGAAFEDIGVEELVDHFEVEDEVSDVPKPATRVETDSAYKIDW